MREETALPHVKDLIERYQLSDITLYRHQLVQSHVDTFETLVNHLPGWINLEFSSRSKYALAYKGQPIVTLACIAPWAPDILSLGEIQYFEMDASFRALAPYVYCVPTAVLRNIGLPLGLLMAPTESRK
jgi:hypothetical protein